MAADTTTRHTAASRAAELPDGFGLMEKVSYTNQGEVPPRTQVIFTRAPESGRFGRRVAGVVDLQAKTMDPYDDGPYGAVNKLLVSGWTVAKKVHPERGV